MNNTKILESNGYIAGFDAKEPNSPKQEIAVKLIACGDTGPVRKLENIVMNKGPQHVLGDLREMLHGADIVFANLECTYSRRGKPLNRIPVFRLDPEVFKIIPEAGINIVSVANNHMFDHGPEAFQDTLNLLDDHKIAHFGGGLTQRESSKPCILEVKGIKFGFLGFRDRESRWLDNNGVFTEELVPEIVVDRIKTLRPVVDWVVLSLHLGWEYQLCPSPRDVEMCRRFIDAGADIILGHHPHFPQGLEIYKDRIIAYSLGNFIWDQNFIGHTSSSYILEFELTKNRIISVKNQPVRLSRDYRLELNNEPDAFDEINTLSCMIIDDHKLNEHWYFVTRNKLFEFMKIIITALKNKELNKKAGNILRYAVSPRFLYTAASFIYFMISGKAFHYEHKKKKLKGIAGS